MFAQCAVYYAEMWSSVKLLIQWFVIQYKNIIHSQSGLVVECSLSVLATTLRCSLVLECLFSVFKSFSAWFVIQYNNTIHSQSGLVVECSLSVLYARLQSNLNKRDVAPR